MPSNPAAMTLNPPCTMIWWSSRHRHYIVILTPWAPSNPTAMTWLHCVWWCVGIHVIVDLIQWAASRWRRWPCRLSGAILHCTITSLCGCAATTYPHALPCCLCLNSVCPNYIIDSVECHHPASTHASSMALNATTAWCKVCPCWHGLMASWNDLDG